MKVAGISKGKGFQGTVKRHNFSRGPVSHGSHNVRAPGSIGASATPSRVFKGIRGPGQMGNKRVTQRGLEVVDVIADKNLLLLRGSVPGPQGRHRRDQDGQLMAKPRPTSARTGTVDLDDAVFGEEFHMALVHETVRAELNARRQGTQSDEDPRRGGDDRRQGLPPEGHRPRPRGRAVHPAAGRRRRRVRPEAAPLHRQGQPQGAPPGAARGAVASTLAAARSRSIDAADFDDAVHQARRRGPRRVRRARPHAGRARPRRRGDAALKSFRNLERRERAVAGRVGVADIIGAQRLVLSPAAVEYLTSIARKQRSRGGERHERPHA